MSFMSNLFVALLLIFCASFTDGYRCYKCMSTQGPGCGDPFDPRAHGIKVIEAKPDELCWATRIGDAFGRAVVPAEMCPWGQDKCVTAFIDDALVTYCCCTSNLCNTQSMAQNTTTTTTARHLLRP